MILEAKNLSKSFKKPFKKESFLAVDQVSLSLKKGQTLGIVGESGSGKSTLAKLLLRLLPADSGEIYFHDKEISKINKNGLKNFRKSVQAVFQEPFASLDPRMKVAAILKEPFFIQGEKNGSHLDEKVEQLLKHVELGPSFLNRLPHQLSGGECQRVAIARAISTGPELIICDEPVSSLDALVQAQILNLFLKLQKEKNISYIFISHDIRVIRHMSDDILVMKEGRVCEAGPRDAVLQSPKSDYTKILLRSAFSRA